MSEIQYQTTFLLHFLTLSYTSLHFSTLTKQFATFSIFVRDCLTLLRGDDVHTDAPYEN